MNARARVERNAGRGKSGTIVVHVSETAPYLMRSLGGIQRRKETGEIFTKAPQNRSNGIIVEAADAVFPVVQRIIVR